ncbi:MAG: helix-turn-helix transcriptional regulator [Tepidisphaeraceae bacterium]
MSRTPKTSEDASNNGNGTAETPAPPVVAQSWAAPIPEPAWPLIAELLSLSGREVDVVRLMLEDKKELAIAMELKISAHTVHTHVERIYRKLHVSSRVELTRVLYGALLRRIAEPGSPLSPICGRRASGECPYAQT